MLKISETIPYTYLIGWTNADQFYYGVQYKNQCNPFYLFRNYFTSSKYVKRMIKIHGEPDIIQIRKTFKTKIEARKWEHKVNRRLTLDNKKFLNKSDASPKLSTIGLVPAISLETGEKLLVSCEEYKMYKDIKYKTASTGVVRTKEQRDKIRQSKLGFVFCINKKENCNCKVTIDEFRKNRHLYEVAAETQIMSKEHIEAMNNARRGQKDSEETKKKRSLALKGRKLPIDQVEEIKRFQNLPETKELKRKLILGEKNPMKNKVTVFDLEDQKKKTISSSDYKLYRDIRYISICSKRYKNEILPHL